MVVQLCLNDPSYSVNEVKISVELTEEVCYIDEYLMEKTKINHLQEVSKNCALSDFRICHENHVKNCKFVDCLSTLDTEDGDMLSHYLFSTCLPYEMTSREIQRVCLNVAKGNDFVDYSKLYIDDDDLKEWHFTHMHFFLFGLIVLILILASICSLSCYYHYKVLRTHEVPFKVPRFCPECLFPHSHYKRLIEHESFVLGQELNP